MAHPPAAFRNSGKPPITLKIVLGIIVVVFSPKIFLTAAETNTAASFLDINTGSRPAAMAGAYTAVADDVFSLRYNPAGLAQQKYPALAFQHNDWGLDMSEEYLAGALPLNGYTLGAGFTYMNYGTIPVRDELGARTGNDMSPSDMLLNVAAGTSELLPNLSLGVGFSVLAENLAGDSQTNVYGDLGIKYHWDELALDSGVALREAGMAIQGYALPAQLDAGLALHLLNSQWILAADGTYPLASGAVQIALGTEAWLWDTLALRLGYRFTPETADARLQGLSLGLGLQIVNIEFAYAYQPLGDVAVSHRLTLSYQFGKPIKASPKTVKKKAAKAPSMSLTPDGKIPLSERTIPTLPEAENYSTRTAEVTLQDKKDAVQIYFRGKKLYDEHKLDEAIEAFSQALYLVPNFPRARQALNAAKRERTRLQLLRAIHPVSQKDVGREAQEWVRRGAEYERQGKWLDAAFAYKSALSLAPKNREALTALKRVQAQAKSINHRTAVARENETMDAPDQTSFAAPLNAKPASKSEGNPPDETMSRAIQKHFLAGNQALEQNDYPDAIREFELILEFDPEHKATKYKLDVARRKLAEEISAAKQQARGAKENGDSLEEAKALQRLVVLDPTDTQARKAFKTARLQSRKQIEELYRQGVTAYAQGEYAQAIQRWNEVLDLEPEHAKAKQSIVKAQEKLKLTKE
jgi:tetratricopeptide (TPR) repeat protein